MGLFRPWLSNFCEPSFPAVDSSYHTLETDATELEGEYEGLFGSS